MKQRKVKILENKRLMGRYFKLAFVDGQISKVARPGQFVLVKVDNGITPLLRKPLGIHKVINSKIIEILYEVVGEGTEILSNRKPGEQVDVIGPLGNGFEHKTQDTRHKTQVLIAGGIGVAPLVFLAQRLEGQGPRAKGQGEKHQSLVLIGAKTKTEVLCEGDFKKLGCKVMTATDDGTKGHKGLITGLLKSFLLTTKDKRLTTIYACGPKPMLKEVGRIAVKNGIPCQVLLEEYMACGVGVCLGCAVKVKTKDEGRRTWDVGRGTREEYKMVCKDGPVFEAKEVVWE